MIMNTYVYMVGIGTFVIGSLLIIGLYILIVQAIRCFDHLLRRARTNQQLN